jgi:hypothetical protein
MKHAQKLSEQGKSKWLFEAAEFPVQVQKEGTRIDFILKLQESPIYLLAECKRANPALSNWCFARAPYVRRNRTSFEPLSIEYATYKESVFLESSARHGVDLKNAYHIAIEVKSNRKGEPYSTGRGAIEAAATQVCRGLNGMIDFAAGNENFLTMQMEAYFLPVIFTTAQVWTSEVDLSLANIESGDLDLEEVHLEEKDWIFYQYHLSPGIKHPHKPLIPSATLGGVLDSEYIRSIAIVTSSGIESFLRWSSIPDRYLR